MGEFLEIDQNRCPLEGVFKLAKGKEVKLGGGKKPRTSTKAVAAVVAVRGRDAGGAAQAN